MKPRSDKENAPSEKAVEGVEKGKWKRRRRLDEIFGNDLPDLTKDESDQGHRNIPKDWYEVNRPPHYE